MTIFSEQINSFSRKLYFFEHGSLLKAAQKPNRKPHLSLYRRNDIHNFEIFAPICIAILCYYYFQFHCECDN